MVIDLNGSVVHDVVVPLDRQRTFALFTERMHRWWPRTHGIGSAPRADVVVEPHGGGRWYERGTDGSECSWGRVAAWERLVRVWQISARWSFDADLETEVEVTFREDEPGRTRVEVVHRHLDRFGDDAEAMRAVFDSPGGWPGILDACAAHAVGV